jgi:hypothetical protein
VCEEVNTETTAGDVPFELPDRSPRPEPDKPKQSESGPNKMDIKNCIATMGFNTIQRKALLRLALAWAERLPTSTSKRNLVAKLSVSARLPFLGRDAV